MKSLLGLVAGGLVLIASVGSTDPRQRQAPAGGDFAVLKAGAPRLDAGFARMALSFIPNEGQIDGDAVYYLTGRATAVYFGTGGVTISIRGSHPSDAASPVKSAAFPSRRPSGPERWTVKLDFVGAADAVPRGEAKTGALVSYFRGGRDEWKTGLPTFSRIVYENLWPGIDLAYSGRADLLKYEFVVRPGADPSAIRLAYRGASSVTLDPQGRLAVDTPLGGFRDQAPVAYQERNGERVSVSSTFRLEGSASPASSSAFGFAVGPYDATLPLVIDPATVIYCGFLGGASDDQATAVAIDATGNAYIAGQTGSPDFPAAAGPDPSFNDASGKSDAFVAKVSADGSTLVYCGFVGGQAEDVASGIAVDPAGNAYIAGWTFSLDFPAVVGPSLVPGVEIWQRSDAFVTKVSADGTALVYSGFIGGSQSDQACGIAVDNSGCAVLTGWTESPDFLISATWVTSLQGARDAFLTKVNAEGTGFDYSRYIGGAGIEAGSAIALDASDYVYITGSTTSPPIENALLWARPPEVYKGNQDAFVARIDPWGWREYCGYIGGTGVDAGTAIAVDFLGCAYVAGTTDSGSDFPVLAGPSLVHHGGNDVFVAKMHELNTGLYYCGFIGGSGDDQGNAIAVDRAGRAYVAGSTTSAADFPVTGGPFLTHSGENDAFLVIVGATGDRLITGSYLGGSGDDAAAAIATDGSGNVFVAGATRSVDFPVSAGAIPGTGAGPSGLSDDAFIARISEDLPPCGPYLLKKGNVTESEIEVTWTDESTNETGFKIERQDNPPPEWAEIATAGTDVTSYTDTGLAEGWPYLFRVRAYNDFGDSEYSLPLLIFTRPAAPSNLTGTAVNDRRIELSWVNHSTRAAEYLVQRRVHIFDPWTYQARVSYDATSYVDTSYLVEDTSYTYRVLAIVSDGTESLPSNEAVVTTPPLSVPLAPSNLEASAPLASQVTLTWVNNAFNAAGFKIERRTGPAGVWAQLGTAALGYNFYMDRSGAENTTYYYRVCAYNNAGSSGYSNEISLTTPAFRPVVRIPLWDVSFTYVDVCAATYQTSSLFNDGDAPLVVTGVTLNSESPDFAYLGPATPFSIAPGGSTEIAIGFRPTQTGRLAVDFSVLSNDPVNGSAPFTVTGLGMGVSATTQLQVQLGTARAWIAQMHYARITAAVTLTAPMSDVTFRLMRKSGGPAYQAIKVFRWAETRAGAWTYTDMYLPPGVSFSYRLEAVDCRGRVISQSSELSTGTPAARPSAKITARESVKR